LDVVVRAQQRQALLDHVLLVALGLIEFAQLEELDDPAWIEIHHEADAAAVLCQVLDGQPEAARTARADHQPVRSAREKLIRQRGAKGFVIGTEVVDTDARFGNAGRAARFECKDGLVGVGARHPAAHGTAAQPLVLKKAEAVEVVVPAYLAPGVPVEAFGIIQPKRAAGGGIEMPRDNFAHPCV
jgi:hypothetical protein